MKEDNIGWGSQAKHLFKIEWKSLDEIIKENLKIAKDELKRKKKK